MQEIGLNYWAVLVAALLRIALGAAWYSPPAFEPTWRAAIGRSREEVRAALPRALVVDVVGSFFVSFVLAMAIGYAGALDVWSGAAVGFLLWLAFMAIPMLAARIYEGRPQRYFLIGAGYHLVALVAIGAILAVWA